MGYVAVKVGGGGPEVSIGPQAPESPGEIWRGS